MKTSICPTTLCALTRHNQESDHSMNSYIFEIICSVIIVISSIIFCLYGKYKKNTDSNIIKVKNQCNEQECNEQECKPSPKSGDNEHIPQNGLQVWLDVMDKAHLTFVKEFLGE